VSGKANTGRGEQIDGNFVVGGEWVGGRCTSAARLRPVTKQLLTLCKVIIKVKSLISERMENFMKLIPRMVGLFVGVLLISSCGGGGGGGGTATDAACGTQVCITASLKDVSSIALTTNTGVSNQTALLDKIKDILMAAFPSAIASSPKINNILAYDASGNAIPNPLVANVNLYIAGVVPSPDGKDVYLFLDDNQNSTLYPDYRAMQNRCILYKISKTGSKVKCLMDNLKYAISNPGRNGREYGNRAEPYIKFDGAGNAYMMAYKGGGSINHRLYKIPNDENPVILRDFIDNYYAQNIVYAKNGNLFYTEVDEFSSSYKSRAFIFDTTQGIFKKIPSLENLYIEKIATSIDGNIYVKVDNSIYRINQEALDIELVDVLGGASSVIELTRGSAGGAFILKSSGEILKVSGTSTKLLNSVGDVPLEPSRDQSTDLYFQRLMVQGDWLAARGSLVEAGDLNPSPAICMMSMTSLEMRCDTLKSSNPIFYTFAFVGDKVYSFFKSGELFKQAVVNISNYFKSSDSYAISPSTAGNGSVVSSISLTPPITFVADLSKVTTSTRDKVVTVSTPVSDTYSYLSFTSANSLTGISPSDLILKDSSGSVVDATFKVVDKTIYAVVKDASGIKPSGYKSLGQTNDFNLVFPSSYTAPALTKGIGTKSGYFPVSQQISVMYLDFSAPVVNIDMTTLQLTDANNTPVPADIALMSDGMTLEVRVKDPDTSSLTGYKRVSSGSTYKLVLPERVRLPGQTFLSPFDKTNQIFSTKS
jgi:hypothetical protein